MKHSNLKVITMFERNIMSCRDCIGNFIPACTILVQPDTWLNGCTKYGSSYVKQRDLLNQGKNDLLVNQKGSTYRFHTQKTDAAMKRAGSQGGNPSF